MTYTLNVNTRQLQKYYNNNQNKNILKWKKINTNLQTSNPVYFPKQHAFKKVLIINVPFTPKLWYFETNLNKLQSVPSKAVKQSLRTQKVYN